MALTLFSFVFFKDSLLPLEAELGITIQPGLAGSLQ